MLFLSRWKRIHFLFGCSQILTMFGLFFFGCWTKCHEENVHASDTRHIVNTIRSLSAGFDFKQNGYSDDTIHYRASFSVNPYWFTMWFFFYLFQALCGVVFEVPTLVGDKLRISTMQEVIKPNTVKRITGYGLPLPKDPSRKGDMLVAFDIKFPEKLTASEKELLSDVLPSV